MTTARVFLSGNSQAVRLPKAFRVEGKEVEQAGNPLAELAGLLPVMALPPHAGEIHGAIRAELAAAGKIIGNNEGRRFGVSGDP